MTKNLKNIKIFFTDIDGVWTDGSMYYHENGNESKRFNTYDSAGVLLLSILNIPLVIISSEQSKIVENRAKKLGIENVFLGVRNKLELANRIVENFNFKLSESAYIGDDLNDLSLLKSVGLSACPKNSIDLVKDNVNWILSKSGGEGVFREFVEKYLKKINILEETNMRVIDKVYNSDKVSRRIK
jgi:3-deoxy-D-glycero-D-galacto-nononate 9-phosphatase